MRFHPIHLRRGVLNVALVVLVALALVSGACASTPPDRVVYTTISSAVDAVQAGMGAFNDLYKQGKFTPDDRAKVLDAYAKFQVVARAATKVGQGATAPSPDVMKLVSDAAFDVLKIIRAFTGVK
jgi:hypothetical protein